MLHKVLVQAVHQQKTEDFNLPAGSKIALTAATRSCLVNRYTRLSNHSESVRQASAAVRCGSQVRHGPYNFRRRK